MLLYSYVFYRVNKWYIKSKDSTPGVYSLGIVTLLQLFTIIEVIALLDLMNFKIKIFSTVTVFIFGLLTILLNYIYFYLINTPIKIYEKIENLNAVKTNRLIILMWVHIIITIGLFILLVNLP